MKMRAMFSGSQQPTRRKAAAYKPRKRRVKIKRNMAYMHAEEERIILRDACRAYGSGSFTGKNLRMSFPMRYHPTLINTALKRMKKKGILRPARTGVGYIVAESYLNLYQSGKEAA